MQALEQFGGRFVLWVILAGLKCTSISVLLGDVANRPGNGYIDHIKRKERSMFVVAVLVFVFLFAVLASADLLVSNIASDELNNMGVEKKS
jgi:hypothetical protein